LQYYEISISYLNHVIEEISDENRNETENISSTFNLIPRIGGSILLYICRIPVAVNQS